MIFTWSFWAFYDILGLWKYGFWCSVGESPTEGRNDTAVTPEAKYPFNFTQSGKKIYVCSLHHNGRNSFLYVNAAKMYQFKAKDSEIKPYPLFLGNISKDFTINNMKQTGLKGFVKIFSVDYNPIDTNDVLDIHRYLMKKAWYKIMFGFIKNMFIVLLSVYTIGCFGASLAPNYKEPIKCVSLNS